MAGLPPVTAAQTHPRRWLRVPYVAASLVGFVMLFYGLENWRGAQAWQRARRQVAAGGGSLDWSSYIAPQVADQLNVLKAPKMAEWFNGNGKTDLARRFGTLYEFTKRSNTNVLANVFIVSPGTNSVQVTADLNLVYRFSTLSPAPSDADDVEPEATAAVIPLIIMEDVPLTDAIKHLAREAKVAYVLDPGLRLGIDAPQPMVSIRWENVTAEQALTALLNNYGLRWVGGSTGIARFIRSNSTEPKVYADPAAQEQIAALIAGACAKSSAPGPSVLQGAQGMPLLSAPLSIEHPVRLAVASAGAPSAREISAFFPTNALTTWTHACSTLRVEPAGSNAFQVLLGPPAYYTAMEYLAWSDQFTNDFDLMRQALRRPQVRRDSDDDPTWPFRTPNFVMTRHVSQALAQRAQCWLLLGRPEEASNELALLRDLRRLLEPDASGRYASIVPAMIDVAVTGLYVSVIADGLRLHAWREPQLLEFQEQLRKIDLPPLLVGALQRERAALCRDFADLGARRLVQSDELFRFGPPRELNSWQRLKRNASVLLAAAPRGWVYQNMALACDLEQRTIDVFDPASRTIDVDKVKQLPNANKRAFAHLSPYNFLAAMTVPDFSRAWHALAHNQARTGQAQVACALERYRLKLHDYPDDLSSLVPQYAAVLPVDITSREPLHYRRVDTSTFVLYSHGWNNENGDEINVSDTELPDAIPQGAWVWE